MDGGGRLVRQVRPVRRRDPAPSRLRYRLTRLWLRPAFRRLMNFGVPLAVGLLAVWTLLSEIDIRSRVIAALEVARSSIVEQPQFLITEIRVPGVSEDLAEQIRIAAFVPLPASSLEVSVASVRARVESLDAVERARVQVKSNGMLEIRAIERIPVVVWRSRNRVELLDVDGIRVAEVDSRIRRPDLPLIAGDGAEGEVTEALLLLDLARPLHDRIRGLVRIGGRRWDLVLDRGQTIRLPEANPDAALVRVMALEAADQLMERDLVVVDMRNPERPMLRLTEHAKSEIVRLKLMTTGEDA
jgi:cell division protein FtsQ